MPPGAVDAAQRIEQVGLARVLGLFTHHVADAQDGVERRAQLMAHGGEEAALGLVGLLRLVARTARLSTRRDSSASRCFRVVMSV